LRQSWAACSDVSERGADQRLHRRSGAVVCDAAGKGLVGGSGLSSRRVATGPRPLARADWFRNTWIDKGITPCIASRKNHKLQIEHDAVLYKKRHNVENMFGRLKDWRRIAMRFDRRADIFLSACVLAAIVLFWI
jgi:transposase